MFLKKIIFFCFFLTGVVLVHSLCAGAPLMVEKNLFAQDRKPPPPESANPTPQATKANVPISNIQLDGIMVNGNSKKALVRMKNMAGAKKPTSPFITVREGQQIGDFRVVRIESKSMSLEKEGQNYTINLFAEGKIASPATPQAPPGNQAPNPAPGMPNNAPPPVPPNQAINVQPRPVPPMPGQEPAANVAIDPAQAATGHVGIPGQGDPNAVAPEQPAPEEDEE